MTNEASVSTSPLAQKLYDEIFQQIEMISRARKRPLLIPVQMLHALLPEPWGDVRLALRELIALGSIRWGKTMNGFYITLPTL